MTRLTSRTRGSKRCGGHVRGCGRCGGHGGSWCGGGCLHGQTRNRSAVGKGDPPISYFWRGQHFDLLNLDQTYYYVCTSVSDASMDYSLDYADPAVYDDG